MSISRMASVHVVLFLFSQAILCQHVSTMLSHSKTGAESYAANLDFLGSLDVYFSKIIVSLGVDTPSINPSKKKKKKKKKNASRKVLDLMNLWMSRTSCCHKGI